MEVLGSQKVRHPNTNEVCCRVAYRLDDPEVDLRRKKV